MWSRIRRTWRMLLNRPLKVSFDRPADDLKEYCKRLGISNGSMNLALDETLYSEHNPLLSQATQVPNKILWLPTDQPRVLYRESDGKVTIERVFQSYEVPPAPPNELGAYTFDISLQWPDPRHYVENTWHNLREPVTNQAESPEDAQDDID